MALTCNIDARGKALRLRIGIGLGLTGLGLLVLSRFADIGWAASVSTVCLLTAAFTLFEARAGWCALRAMGVKTPM